MKLKLFEHSKTHRLKTWPSPFTDTRSGVKSFEFRKNDRDFEIGDRLILEEWDPKVEKFTGEVLERDVIHILYGPDFGIPQGFCVMSIV